MNRRLALPALLALIPLAACARPAERPGPVPLAGVSGDSAAGPADVIDALADNFLDHGVGGHDGPGQARPVVVVVGHREVVTGARAAVDALVDVTIVFPGRGGAAAPTLWQLVSGQTARVVVRARQVPIPDRLRSRNFRTDPDFRRELELWVSRLWQEKDELIAQLERADTEGEV